MYLLVQSDADKVDKKKKDDKDLFKLTDLVIGAALLGRNKEANKKAVSELDEKSKKTIEKIADKVDKDHPEGSRQEKEKATKELIQDLSGKSVKSTDDLTDGTAIRKALAKIDPSHFEETRADAQERDPTRKVKKTVELIEKYFSEKMGREEPKDAVDAEKVVKERDENELFKLTDLVVGAALLGKNKEVTKKTVEKLRREVTEGTREGGRQR